MLQFRSSRVSVTALGVQPIEKSGRPREGEKEASSTAPYAGEREREREGAATDPALLVSVLNKGTREQARGKSQTERFIMF